MRDEIREKYGKWLGTPGDRSKVGEMTEKELLLGRTLKRMREHRQIPLEELAKGICAPSDMVAMENGIKSSLLITGAYLTRMGKSINKFEFYSTNLEYEQQCKRDNIIELWKAQNLEEAGNRLAEYDRYFRSKYNESWSNWQKCCIALRRDNLPERYGKIWEELVGQKLYFTQEEMDYLWELVKYYERRMDVVHIRETYSLMYRNTMATGMFLPQSGRGMDEERKLEILPELCLSFGHFEHMQGRAADALQVLDTAISLLRGSMRMRMLEELLAERMTILKELWENGSDVEVYGRMCKDAEYLIVLDLVGDKFEKAFERLCWLKEEAKWGNTILDSLYTVLEKRLG